MLESLKDSKHHNQLLRLMDFTWNREVNPIFKTIAEADQDFNYSPDLIIFKFFYTICPMVSFAVYYDDYKIMSGLSGDQLRTAFLYSSQIIIGSLVSGQDILLKNNKIEANNMVCNLIV